MATKKTPTRRFIFPKGKPTPKRQFIFPWDKKGQKAGKAPLKKISRRMK